MSDKSLYGRYISEREGREILEDERGFATYTFTKDGIYIQEIYVLPEFRQEGVASQYADVIAGIAKANGLSKLFGSVCPSAKGSTASMKVLLAYGFEIESAAINMIYLVKNI